MRANLLIYASEEIIGKAWDTFVAQHQEKMASGKTEAVVVVSSHGETSMQKVQMTILDGTKMCKITWTTVESEVLWTQSDEGDDVEDLDSKLVLIHGMLNGVRQEVKQQSQKPLFQFATSGIA